MKKPLYTFLLVLAIACIAVLPGYYLVNYTKAALAGSDYNGAIALMENGKYAAAMDRFNKLGDYEYARAYYYYCKAHWEADVCNDYGKAYAAYSSFTRYKKGLSPLPKDYSEFREEMEAYPARQYEKWLQGYLQEKEEYVRKLQDAPFVGMWESDIARTGLGKPSPNIEHNTEMVNDKRKTANLYRWESRPNVVIFSARCLDGKVTSVWDRRANPWDRNYHGPKITPKPHAPDDYLDSWSYDSFEDFFDDCEEFFEDEEEAEDYYYEYNDY